MIAPPLPFGERIEVRGSIKSIVGQGFTTLSIMFNYQL